MTTTTTTRRGIAPPGTAAAADERPLPVADPQPGDATRASPLRRAWRGPAADPPWARPALLVTLALAALLYTWDLAANGMGNTYYAAAVKSGTVSWKAFLFGSLDPGSFITVDKPPMALWAMALSARLFGFSSWSMLAPEAVAGVASVAVVWRLVKQWMGPVAGLIAATAFAVTPVAVLMFRLNDPDALLTLLMLLGVWGVWSAMRRDRAAPLALAGVTFGAAFLTKMLAGVIVMPAVALVYLCCADTSLRRRILRLLVAGLAFLVSAGWWVALVELWPASSRPYIGGSTNNSVLDLVFGYNGLSRVTGNGGGAGPAGGSGGGGGPNFGGAAGWGRMFNTIVGGQVSWLIPIAAIGLVGGLWLAGRAARTDRTRGGFLLWAGFTSSLFVVFSLAQGIFHPYYVVALAPGVAALAGGGVVALWRLGHRSDLHAWVLPLAIAVTAWWSSTLLDRTPGFVPWLRYVLVVVALGAALVLGVLRAGGARRAGAVAAAAIGVAAMLAGPVAYALDTASRATSGPTPNAGPTVASGNSPGTRPPAGVGGAGFGAPPGGSASPGGFAPPPGTSPPSGARPGTGLSNGSGARLGAVNADARLVAYLEAHRGRAKYVVATFGSQTSASIIVATGQPVVTIGGFNGSDPAPTLAQFTQLVASGQLRYVLVSRGGPGGVGPGGAGPRGGGATGTTSSITQWVTEHGTRISYGGSGGTLYEVRA